MHRKLGAHYLGLSALIFLIVSCGGSNVKLNHAPRNVLKQHQHVAVVDVKIEMVESGLIKDAMDMAKTQFKPLGGTGDNGKVDLEEYAISSINRNLLQKGFIPLQRSKIKNVMKEQQLQQSGMTLDSSKLGALLKADAIFQGSIVVKKKAGIEIPLIAACLFPPLFIIRGGDAEILFSGSMTSVESGYIVLSGTSSRPADRFSLAEVDTLVNDWFDKMPDLE